MKLIAVGTTSPDPSKWRHWDGVELVLAPDLQTARRMQGYHEAFPAVEVDMTKAGLVMKMAPYIDHDNDM
jgi:hypothetical protein